MSPHNSARTAVVVDASPRWRAIVADALREAGWTAAAVATWDEAQAVPNPDLAVLAVTTPADQTAALQYVSQAATKPSRCILLANAPASDLPAALRTAPGVAGVVTKRAWQPEALVGLLGPVGAAPPGAAATQQAGPPVLVVEDDSQWRAIYEELLTDAGMLPYFAVSYGEARGWLQNLDFALAIVDLNLASSAAPDGNRDGLYLLRAARPRGVPTIVVSALGDPDDIDRAYDEFGIFAFVEKEGFDRRNFLRLVDRALEAVPDARADAGTTADHRPPTAGVASAPLAESEALAQLTRREREVLALLVQGCTNRQIAEALLISANTTKKHVDHILQKLGATTRAGAVAAAMRPSPDSSARGSVKNGPNGPSAAAKNGPPEGRKTQGDGLD